MDSPNFVASVAYTFETESRRNEKRSDAAVDGSVYANPPAWAGFSLRKLWSRFNADGKADSTSSGEGQELGETPLSA